MDVSYQNTAVCFHSHSPVEIGDALTFLKKLPTMKPDLSMRFNTVFVVIYDITLILQWVTWDRISPEYSCIFPLAQIRRDRRCDHVAQEAAENETRPQYALSTLSLCSRFSMFMSMLNVLLNGIPMGINRLWPWMYLIRIQLFASTRTAPSKSVMRSRRNHRYLNPTSVRHPNGSMTCLAVRLVNVVFYWSWKAFSTSINMATAHTSISY